MGSLEMAVGDLRVLCTLCVIALFMMLGRRKVPFRGLLVMLGRYCMRGGAINVSSNVAGTSSCRGRNAPLRGFAQLVPRARLHQEHRINGRWARGYLRLAKLRVGSGPATSRGAPPCTRAAISRRLGLGNNGCKSYLRLNL